MAHSIELRITGMSCASCVARVEKTLKATAGVVDASVNLATERAHVSLVSDRIDPEAVAEAVTASGYKAEIYQGQRAPAEDLRRDRILVWLGLGLCLPLLLPMLVGRHDLLPPWVQLALALPVQLFLGARFYRHAFAAVKARSGNMDLLIAIGTSAAFFLSLYHFVLSPLHHSDAYPLYFESAAVIITLVRLGKYWEKKAKFQTTAAIRALEGLRPDRARVRRQEGEFMIPLRELKVGDLLLVFPGERLAADGRIKAGRSHVDESMLTGESMPVVKNPGDVVTGGTLNGDGLLEVAVTTLGAESALARMIRLIENAQVQKPAVQRLVDTISAWFVPLILGIALTTFIGSWLAGIPWEQALIRAVAVLVIACPCALGLATPTSILVGTGIAAKAGILIRDAEAIEVAEKISYIVFDKTGTLTQGVPALTSIETWDRTEGEVLDLILAIQKGNDHPLAKALTERYPNRAYLAASDIQALPGRGVSGKVKESTILIGNRTLMEENGIDINRAETLISRLGEKGHTLSVVADNGVAIAILVFSDTVKDHAKAAVSRLKQAGYELGMLTGDNPYSAEKVRREVGIDHARAELGPAQKLKVIRELRLNYPGIAMVGDGINDGPALAAADLSIAMGSGTDVAMQTASITLLRDDLRLVPEALAICHAISSKIKQNLFWAFFYNLIGVPLAAFGYLSPVIAGAAMAMSSLSVLGNSLLLKTWKSEAV